MPTKLDDKIMSLSRSRREKIRARAAELIAEEMSLRELRRAQELTQKRVARMLGVGQEGVSRLEQRSDARLSTLRNYVESLGGRLHLYVEFPNRAPVHLSGFTASNRSSTVVRRRKPSLPGSKGNRR